MNISFFSLLKWSPPRILVVGFAIIIMLGALLLSLPFASADGSGLRFLDAFFTATSATSVTGLVVVDSGTYFSVPGQVIIMLLIQIGGLGFMTMGTLFALVLKKRISLRSGSFSRSHESGEHGGHHSAHPRVIVYSLSFELVGRCCSHCASLTTCRLARLCISVCFMLYRCLTMQALIFLATIAA